MLHSILVCAIAALGADALAHPPARTFDLKTLDGARAAGAVWRGAEAQIVGANPGGGEIRPRAETAEYDDSAWPTIAPTDLELRRGGGKVSFYWYRLRFTVPDRIGGLDPDGASLFLNLRVDDYAEVWVNGALPYGFGQSGGAVVAGWNAPNRVLLTEHAHPGQEISVAIFAMNGPISQAPANAIWIREATLEVHASPRAVTPEPVSAEIVRFDPALDAILPPGSAVERIAAGFIFTEGPVWHRASASLLFSDPNANVIYRWWPAGRVEVFRHNSGYSGADVAEYRQAGSNGLTFDPHGRLVVAQHGNRRIVRLEADGAETALADRHLGRRLNSPNDLVLRSDGTLYFTDPSFGLPMFEADPRREMSHNGVYMLRNGRVTLLDGSLKGPNGVALNHKETHLYVGDWDDDHKAVMRYAILADGSLGPGETFCDLTAEPGADAIDGVKVDSMGNVYVCGPGGLWIFDDAGARLGLLRNVETPHNIAFGGADGRTLFLCCETGLYRVRLGVDGPMP